jgi:O-antigen/teichoic acid export membrane protein
VAAAESPVLRGAASLYGSTITTSALGFLFWLVAARLLAPSAVGSGSAAQSAAQLIATVGLLGLGTLTIAELSVDRTEARSLIAAASVVAATVSAGAALIAGLTLSHTTGRLAPSVGGVVPLVMFALLAGTTAAGLIADDACIGLLRGRIQLTRNTVFAAGKLALLPIAIYALDLRHGEEIVLVWLIATVPSLVLAYRLIGGEAIGSWRPDFANLVAKRRLIWSHHLLNVAVIGPRLLAPVVVAAVVSPSANAGFYTASLITGFVNIIPAQLSIALFAVKPGDAEALTKETRITMRLCVVLSVLSGLFFLFASHGILELFRRTYVSAAPAMAVLGFVTLPSAVKAHYVAIARVQGRMAQAARLATLAAAGEITGVLVGATTRGVTGTAVGLLIAYIVEALLFGPTVVRVLRGPRSPSIASAPDTQHERGE